MEFFFDQTDFLSLLFPALILIYIGQYCLKLFPDSEIWGKQIASALFLFLIGAEILTSNISDPMEFASTTISALLTAGLVLGLCWTFLPLPLYLFQETIGRGISDLKILKQNRHQKNVEQQQKKEAQLRQQRNREKWERNAPERERQEKQQQQAVQKRNSDQHQREQIRLDCQLLYDQHAHQLQERFPRERLVEYFEQYLSDGFPIEIVEQRGALLKEMIASTLDQIGGNKQKFSSIIEISTYFENQRKEIESLDFDKPTKESYITSLNEQEDRVIQEFMLS